MAENRAPAVRRVLGRAGQAGAAGVLFAVLAGGPALAQAAPDPPSVKYYIVPHADNPDDITLFRIAERALGDGNRFPEIFRLNQGRPRPDGSPFTDATRIEPGQVLQLPEDAQDPAVRFGPLPAAPPVPVPAPVAAPEPSGVGVGLASAVSGSGGLLTGLIAGLWWRRRPQLVPPPPFEPPEAPDPLEPETGDDCSGSVSGTLPIPVVPAVLRPEPSTAEHAIIVLDTADTQVIAAVRPGSRFHFKLGGPPDFADGSTVLVVDDDGR
ncbi:LysM peptidoglycan-binding domain-containing protein [Amycolatopsis sp. cmx-4-83]|uniref:LysM peptidoglycan-binding domain-containing protein n=1 Tax=Amycolatopsis sp. cmx-4-83 TaxID=2790940 RepID=UPI00397B8F76